METHKKEIDLLGLITLIALICAAIGVYVAINMPSTSTGTISSISSSGDRTQIYFISNSSGLTCITSELPKGIHIGQIISVHHDWALGPCIFDSP